MSDPEEIVEIDVRGEVCPYPELMTKRRLEQMDPGTMLHVLTDHGAATRNVPDMVEHTGLGRCLEIRPEGRGIFRIVVRREGGA